METIQPQLRPHGRALRAIVCFVVGGILLLIAYLAGITDNPPGIAAMFGGGMFIIAGIVSATQRTARSMGLDILYWSPRILVVTYALFISIFAIDVFDEPGPVWQIALSLFMHLIPTFLILILLVISWRREWIGAAIFLALPVAYYLMMSNRPFFSLSVLLVIGGPLVLTGVLFFVNWRKRSVLRAGSV